MLMTAIWASGRPIARALFLIALAMTAPATAGTAAYLLGPQDRLKIKVYDWRTEAGEAHEWAPLTGEFTVGADGHLHLPLVGEVLAGNQTISGVAQDLSARLQRKVGLAQPPDTEIEIAEYRPFYIVGAVQKAGAYPYRPDLTVLQAVGIAGGLVRSLQPSAVGYEREILVVRGQIRQLTAEKLALQLRQARLDAEIAGTNSVVFPKSLLSKLNDKQLDQMMHDEDTLYAEKRISLATKIDNIHKSHDLIQSELTALGAKDASLARQLDLAKQELGTVSSLVNKGLTVLPRQLEVERNVSQYESSRLDVQLAQLHAREDMARLDRDVSELQNDLRSTALTEMRETRAKLLLIDREIQTSESLEQEAEDRGPEVASQVDQDGTRLPRFTITRPIDGTLKRIELREDDMVQPGDTITVTTPRNDLLSNRQP